MLCRAWMILSFLCLAVLTGGCGRSYTFVPVEGTITQGGKPLAGVQVTFYTDTEAGTQGPQSYGMTDAAGHYQLRTYQRDTGAVVGHHRVCIVKSRLFDEDTFAPLRGNKVVSSEMVTALKKRKESTELKLPSKYGNIKETPLRVEVRPGGTQTFDFDIPSQ